MCVNVCYSQVCDSNDVIRIVRFEIHSARAIRTCTHIHIDASKCVISEGFESVIRCVSTCVIPKCVIRMV